MRRKNKYTSKLVDEAILVNATITEIIEKIENILTVLKMYLSVQAKQE